MTGPRHAVSCPGCGRGYAAERFLHGRAFRCACGERVGLRLEREIGAPAFIADVMLQRLARWLRALGHDAAWEPEIADEELVRRGIEEDRVILTRDRRLAADWWVDGLLLLESGEPLRQLAEVSARFPLSGAGLFTRCTWCNAPLRPASRADVEERVPHAVRAEGHDFRECPSCRRVYWEGGHAERMRRALDAALGGDGGA